MLHDASPGLRRSLWMAAALLAVVVALFTFPLSAFAADTVVTVNPTGQDGWAPYDESFDFPGGTGSAALVAGPLSPPAGSGSVALTVNTDGRMNYVTPQFKGVRLADITKLEYYTLRSSRAPGADVITFQMELDYDSTDANTSYQNRLVYVPPTATADTWEQWNLMTGAYWWRSTGGYAGVCSMAAPCDWATVLSTWPNAVIHPGYTANNYPGLVLLRAGGPSTAPGFTGYADKVTIGVSGNNKTFDFEGNGLAYNSIPFPQPFNLPSLGFEAYSGKELGDFVAFTPASTRALQSVTVLMSSWGCESGDWTGSSGTCTTTPGSSFSHPITLNLYEAVGSGSTATAGTKIASKTVTFDIPYRPSANCPDGTTRWLASNGQCFNGFAVPITFNFAGDSVVLPDQVVWGIEYNTTHQGYAKIGDAAACYGEPGGCGYDSLNIALSPAATVGTDVDPNGYFWYTTYAPFLCNPLTVNQFANDTPCSPEQVPAASFEMAPPALYVEDAVKKFNTGGPFDLDVPVKLSTSESVHGLNFSVGYPACLGMPSIVGAPLGYAVDSFVENNVAQIQVYWPTDTSLPTAIPAGQVAMLSFADASACGPNDSVASFSFGATQATCAKRVGDTQTAEWACGTDDGNVTLDFNSPPTDLSLDPLVIPENQPYSGALSSSDPDGNPPIYALAEGCTENTDPPSSVNLGFSVSGSSLLHAAWDYDSFRDHTLDVCVSVDDGRGSLVKKGFTIEVTNVNDLAPAVTSTSFSIAENNAVGATIGDLTASDPDLLATTFTFAESNGCDAGTFDNGKVSIQDLHLVADALYDFEALPSFKACIVANDGGLDSAPTLVTVNVTNVNEAPTFLFERYNPPYLAEGPYSADDQTGWEFRATSEESGEFNYAPSSSCGAGPYDNSLFAMTYAGLDDVQELIVATAFSADVTVKSAYNLCFEVTEVATGEKSYHAVTMPVVPFTISLDDNNIDEGLTAPAVVGNLSQSPIPGDPPVLSLPVGMLDNGKFVIVGGVLKANETFDFETRSSYQVTVRSTFSENGAKVPFHTYDKTFTINVTNVNEAPTALSLSPLEFTIDTAKAGMTLGTFSITDPDSAGDSRTFARYTCAVTDSSTPFVVDNDQAITLEVGAADLAANTYPVSVRCTDGENQFHIDGTFNVVVYGAAMLDIAGEEAPWSYVARKTSTIENVNVVYTAGNNPTDATLAFSVGFDNACLQFVSSVPAGSASGSTVAYSIPNAASGTVVSMKFTALASCPDDRTGAGFTGAMRKDSALSLSSVTLSKSGMSLVVAKDDGAVVVIDNSKSGDCNATDPIGASSKANAADTIATVLEIFGTNASLDPNNFWLDAPMFGHDGSPFGCDSNYSSDIDTGDIICTVKASFGLVCDRGAAPVLNPGVNPADTAAALLSVPKGAAQLPVTLDSQGAQVAAVTFGIQLEPGTVFDATDANGDGNPDAVAFAANPNLVQMAMYDAESNTINVAVAGTSLPLPTLDGVLANVQVQGGVKLVNLSASDAEGNAVPLRGQVGDESGWANSIYLPTITNK